MAELSFRGEQQPTTRKGKAMGKGKKFQFAPEVREQVRKITEAMEWANNQSPFAIAHDAYASLHRALGIVIDYGAGGGMAERIANSRHGYNFGGSGSFLGDVEEAIGRQLGYHD